MKKQKYHWFLSSLVLAATIGTSSFVKETTAHADENNSDAETSSSANYQSATDPTNKSVALQSSGDSKTSATSTESSQREDITANVDEPENTSQDEPENTSQDEPVRVSSSNDTQASSSNQTSSTVSSPKEDQPANASTNTKTTKNKFTVYVAKSKKAESKKYTAVTPFKHTNSTVSVDVNNRTTDTKDLVYDNAPIDEWMPDKKLQSVILGMLKDDNCTDNPISQDATVANITKSDMLRLINFDYRHPDYTVISFTGMKYATNLTDVLLNPSNVAIEYGPDFSESMGVLQPIQFYHDLNELWQLPNLESFYINDAGSNSGDLNALMESVGSLRTPNTDYGNFQLEIGGEGSSIINNTLTINQNNYKKFVVSLSSLVQYDKIPDLETAVNPGSIQFNINGKEFAYDYKLDENTGNIVFTLELRWYENVNDPEDGYYQIYHDNYINYADIAGVIFSAEVTINGPIKGNSSDEVFYADNLVLNDHGIDFSTDGKNHFSSFSSLPIFSMVSRNLFGYMILFNKVVFEPVSTPNPDPDPDPEPKPNPDPEPKPEPDPTPKPNPKPIPTPKPEKKKFKTPVSKKKTHIRKGTDKFKKHVVKVNEGPTRLDQNSMTSEKVTRPTKINTKLPQTNDNTGLPLVLLGLAVFTLAVGVQKWKKNEQQQ